MFSKNYTFEKYKEKINNGRFRIEPIIKYIRQKKKK